MKRGRRGNDTSPTRHHSLLIALFNGSTHTRAHTQTHTYTYTSKKKKHNNKDETHAQNVFQTCLTKRTQSNKQSEKFPQILSRLTRFLETEKSHKSCMNDDVEPSKTEY